MLTGGLALLELFDGAGLTLNNCVFLLIDAVRYICIFDHPKNMNTLMASRLFR